MVKSQLDNYARHNSTDEELVKLFLESQDNRYFEKLYERYSFKVYQKCLSLIKDASKAEDLTHDVFLKLIFKMDTFKEDAKFSTWLFSITYNHCMDLLRSNKKRIVTVYEEAADLVDDQDILAVFEADEVNMQSLKHALDQLALDDKALLFMKYMDDLSIRDIAKTFKLTESAVKMRLMRSREKLKRKYYEALLFQ
ncbi:sigma-70 family RNA polymerase sigma factor [Dyadobacter flavalbus]|uniref:Sigma-70 family RNA polymerase sigma factor n=1 Tax=Dyadobacter flavalbus TaxID=2579942 RepID=A0A5M8R256_9BACT|nr:sigma-70 family RNA polymerase sigma factor [Dyadobacter flavalbus]KAA6441771.1 sigma-70 family RNA polymerase sigma factor [Dyadobacter flavalbus]